MKYRVFSKALGVYLNQSMVQMNGLGQVSMDGVMLRADLVEVEPCTGVMDFYEVDIYVNDILVNDQTCEIIGTVKYFSDEGEYCAQKDKGSQTPVYHPNPYAVMGNVHEPDSVIENRIREFMSE